MGRERFAASEMRDRKSSEGDLSSKTLKLTNVEGTALHAIKSIVRETNMSFIQKRDK